MESILKEYENKNNQKDILTSNRQGEAANAVAMLIVGLLLYIYHWRIIQRENKKEI